jgi:hypothetical protein
MNADDLKKLTTESLKELAALLEQGRSERLIALLKTRAASIATVCTTSASLSRNGRGRARLGCRAFTPGGMSAASFAKARRASRSSRRSSDVAVKSCKKTNRGVVVGFRTAYVFDVDQTDGARHSADRGSHR